MGHRHQRRTHERQCDGEVTENYDEKKWLTGDGSKRPSPGFFGLSMIENRYVIRIDDLHRVASKSIETLYTSVLCFSRQMVYNNCKDFNCGGSMPDKLFNSNIMA